MQQLLETLTGVSRNVICGSPSFLGLLVLVYLSNPSPDRASSDSITCSSPCTGSGLSELWLCPHGQGQVRAFPQVHFAPLDQEDGRMSIKATWAAGV